MANNATETLAKAALAALGLLVLFVFIGESFGLRTAFVAFVLFAALSYGADTTGRINVGFTVSLLGVLALAVELFAPPSIAGAIGGALSSLGLPVPQFSGTMLFFWAIAMLPVMWAIDIRFISKTGKGPDTVAKRLTSRAEKLVDEYATVSRIILVGVVSIGYVVLEQGAVFAGDIGEILASAPAIAGWGFTSIAGFLSLGGTLPWIGDVPWIGSLSAGGFALMVGAIMLLAVGVQQQS